MEQVKQYYHNIDLVKNKLLNAVLNPITNDQRLALVLNESHAGYLAFVLEFKSFYFWTGTEWDTFAADGSFLDADFTVNLGSNGSVGGVDDQQVLPIGTTAIDILKQILTKSVSPGYISPVGSLYSNIAPANFEVGEIISPVLNYTFSQNDAGILSTIELLKNNTILSSSLPYVDANLTLEESAVSYQGKYYYEEGLCKENNLGVEDCTGRIPAGQINTNIITYTPKRKVFYGTPGTDPVSSNDIRDLSFSWNSFENTTVNSNGLPVGGITTPNFTLSVPIGATKVVIAYPGSLRPIASIKYAELSDSEIKGNFIESTISVSGKNDLFPINYRVYTYTPVEPFSINVNYKIFI